LRRCGNQLINQVCAELGFPTDGALAVEARPYKMIVTETHGRAHHDVPRFLSATLLATLIIQLPCQYTGGALMVSNNGETKSLDMTEHCIDQFKYAAFYADCKYNFEAHPPVESVSVWSTTCLQRTSHLHLLSRQQSRVIQIHVSVPWNPWHLKCYSTKCTL
jgi:hypothetical protein